MCFLDRKQQWDFPEKSIKELLEIMPYLQRVLWQGGEVFLHKHFLSLLDTAASYNIHQSITTNGLLFTEELIEKMIKYEVFLKISIDSVKPDVYEGIRVGAKFTNLINILEKFKIIKQKYNNNFVYVMTVVVMKSNYTEIEEMVKFAHKYGFDMIDFNPIGFDIRVVNEQIFSDDYDKNIIDEIRTHIDSAAKLANELGIKLNSCLPIETKKKSEPVIEDNKDAKNTVVVQNNKEESTQLECNAPWKAFFIDSYGVYKPACQCMALSSFVDLENTSLLELWNSQLMQNYRNIIKNGEMNSKCSWQCRLNVADKARKFLID